MTTLVVAAFALAIGACVALYVWAVRIERR
jgi:hypothetical protein